MHDVGAVLVTLRFFFIASRVHVACLALLVWDYLLTLDKEISLFWRHRQWSLIRCLFLLNRYATPLLHTVIVYAVTQRGASDAACSALLKVVFPTTGGLQLAVIQTIIVCRLCAMYNAEPRVVKAVMIVCMLTTGASIGIMSVAAASIGVTAHPFNGMNACFDVSSNDLLWLTPLPVIPCEVFACSLAVRRSWQHREVRRLAGHTTASRILDILSRDSVVYFVAILAIDVSMAVIWRTGPIQLRRVFASIFYTASSMLGNHLLFNPREKDECMRSMGSSAEQMSLPTLSASRL